MALIKNIETLRQFVTVNFTNSTSKMPDIAACENKYIKPILGNDLYNDLQVLVDANNSTDALLKLVRAAIAPLAYFEDLPFIHLQISDVGLGTHISENVKSANKWEYEKVSKALADKGCTAMEVLLQYLYDNKEESGWIVPDSYNLIFITGKEFAYYFSLYQPYRTFESLRPMLQQAENDFLKPNIGDTFFNELKDIEYSEDDAIKTIQKEVIVLLKKAAAFKTIQLAATLLPAKYTGNGFTTLYQSSSENVDGGDTSALQPTLVALQQSCEKNAANYLELLLKTLNKNASAELFNTFYSSNYYTNPTIEKQVSINEQSNCFIF